MGVDDGEVGAGAQAASLAASFIEPVTAAVLYEREIRRRDLSLEQGRLRSGCGEVDDSIMLGGFERGSVVGVSVEEEMMGMQMAFQVLARMLATSLDGDSRVMIITAQPAAGILPKLRDAVAGQLAEKDILDDARKNETRKCLQRVSVSRVFDLEGLWEVLGDLDMDVPSEAPAAPGGRGTPNLQVTQKTSGARGNDTVPDNDPEKGEIADSEGEDEALSSGPSTGSSSSPRGRGSVEMKVTGPEHRTIQAPETTTRRVPLPEVIIITHFSTLLTTLFTQREKKPAHSALQLLSSHLRYLSRNLPSNPLILLLNSTSSAAAGGPQDSMSGTSHLGKQPSPRKVSEKPLDATLRSIFNPPPASIPGYRSGAASRKNKPSFGQVFAQLLDMHLLCTLVPREQEDAEKVFAPFDAETTGPEQAGSGTGEARYVWVVEVLLDQIGAWEGKKGEKYVGPRRSREQRWGAVEVSGGRIVDAFAGEKDKREVYGEIRLAAGFGGPRV